MLLAQQAKRLPGEGEQAALPETMERFNEACDRGHAAREDRKAGNGFAGPAGRVAATNIVAGGLVDGPAR